MTQEWRRVGPVVAELVQAGACVSVDTMRAEVATAAVTAGARLVNDVSGGRADPEMFAAVAERGVAYVCMHWRGHADRMQQRAVYDDVVSQVVDELGQQIGRARAAGIAGDRLVVDAGFGFAKTEAHNWQLLRRIDEFAVLGLPQLVGLSRKAFLGTLLSDADGRARPPRERDDASTALTAVLALSGIWGVRVHDVRSSRDAVEVVARLRAEPAHR